VRVAAPVFYPRSIYAMPFEIGRTFNDGAAWLCRSRPAAAVFRNPIVTALVVTAIAFSIVFAVCAPRAPRVSAVRAGIWTFLATTLVLSVHYYALRAELKRTYERRGVQSIVQSIHGAALPAGSAHRVVPRPAESLMYGGAERAAAPTAPARAAEPPAPRDELRLHGAVLPSDAVRH
jgi:hypothetical protein